ncbi:MAG: hypothetical protein ACOYNB_05790 [Aquabacterium sp.]
MSVLIPFEGIEAISIGGSRALGLASATSDFDIVLHTRDANCFANNDLIKALEQLGEGCKLTKTPALISAEKGGQKFEFFLKDLPSIERDVEQARQGKFKWFIKPLFPHGDLSTTPLAHLAHLDCMFDRSGALKRVRDAVTPMPPALVTSLLQYFSVQMDITVIHALKVNKYADLQYLVALSSQFVFFFDILMFALNDTYPVLEKGGARLVQRLPKLPEQYADALRVLLPVDGTLSLDEAHTAMQALNTQVQTMVKDKLSVMTGVRS